ncbi:3-dehydro-L-gulonate 2-dehydrogenase [Granulicella sp. 5B5]|uniref:3-dehydro-L-gulonate 2-dehydrogenase n=1 Tax=Granulicella sp. 5B5 TaxID=1617967 RepID=UPI0015F6E0B2|nr:3-dehydro-L-gulonate 2-dehydrogenase [Granulicella sp. 5B5]QMV18741.1 3-dehydro-L-gulonate 2-dehydrogenase [Granulicella sp. 5B5]
MRRIAFDELRGRIETVLLGLGLPPERAALGARLTAETDRDGVKTHGIARLPRFAAQVRAGFIAPAAVPECVASFGAIERWAGHRGPGNLAAHAAMQRAMQLAQDHGIGCVALGDTSHWMRAGSYGWMAAEAGYAAMCWSNTLPNLPPWGASTPALGNNPLVVAVPRFGTDAHEPIMLDIAMSQFSYGSLSSYAAHGVALPVPGGFDEHGVLTTDAAAIERTQRALPIGFWKGSGLSFVLDVLGAMLSGGKATYQFSPNALEEVGQSQVFLAIAPAAVSAVEQMRTVVDGAIAAVHAATPVEAGKPARYPGEGALRIREESLKLGVAVEEAAWEGLLTLEEEMLK